MCIRDSSSTGMNSLNHYSYGAVLEWIFCHAAGIDVTEQSPGGRVMRISPKVNRGLGYVKAVYDSACGCYQCGWEILGDNKITVTVTVPFEMCIRDSFKVRIKTVTGCIKLTSGNRKL